MLRLSYNLEDMALNWKPYQNILETFALDIFSLRLSGNSWSHQKTYIYILCSEENTEEYFRNIEFLPMKSSTITKNSKIKSNLMDKMNDKNKWRKPCFLNLREKE